MTVAIATITGACLGQALSLLFDRLYTDAPLGGPLVRCRDCRASPRPANLLPVLELALTRGRCTECRRLLPLHAFVLPAGGGLLFALAQLKIDGFGPALLGGFFATVFLALALTDLDRRLLPNRVVYSTTLLAAGLCWAWPDTSIVQVLTGGLAAAAIAAALLLFSLPFGRGAFGMGDVKMIVLIGFVTGLPAVFIGILVGTLAGGVAAALLVVTRLRKTSDYIPHGPSLSLGGIVALFWGQAAWDWYFDR